MITDIQRQAMQRAGPEQLTAAPAQAGAAATEIKPVELHQPTKPVIHVDPEEMAKNLRNAIDQINTMMRDGGRGLNFVIDDAINQPIIKVTRSETGEVIRQIPNEVVVRVAHNLEKLQGLLFSSEA